MEGTQEAACVLSVDVCVGGPGARWRSAGQAGHRGFLCFLHHHFPECTTSPVQSGFSARTGFPTHGFHDTPVCSCFPPSCEAGLVYCVDQCHNKPAMKLLVLFVARMFFPFCCYCLSLFFYIFSLESCNITPDNPNITRVNSLFLKVRCHACFISTFLFSYRGRKVVI